MNYGDPDSQEELTAYHEAGHAVVGYSLGGTVQSVQLGGEADDWLPERFGDCRIAWHPAGEEKIPIGWHQQREVLTILAGPVAEMVYTQQHHHPALFGPWQHDWVHADQLVRPIIADPRTRCRLLEQLIVILFEQVRSDRMWAAIAAVADELLAHELLEEESLIDVLEFWMSRD